MILCSVIVQTNLLSPGCTDIEKALVHTLENDWVKSPRDWYSVKISDTDFLSLIL